MTFDRHKQTHFNFFRNTLSSVEGIINDDLTLHNKLFSAHIQAIKIIVIFSVGMNNMSNKNESRCFY
jgi:hypothetical protein